MNGASQTFVEPAQPFFRQKEPTLPLGLVNRQGAAVIGLPAREKKHIYPSPPMSSSPSPPLATRTTAEAHLAPAIRASSGLLLQEGLSGGHRPFASIPEPSLPSQQPPQAWYTRPFSQGPQAISPPAASAATATTGLNSGGAVNIPPYPPTTPSYLISHELQAASAGREGDIVSRSRSSRRTKAHVASACVNCKRAHLSCDIQRPCTRCVATGKQVRLVMSRRVRVKENMY
jgi:hypothetical protein